MCGILGYIGNIPKNKQKKAFTVLKRVFALSSTRGKHASGFAATWRDNNILATEKRPIPSPEFVKKSVSFRALQHNMPAIFIGHTRFTTNGPAERCRNNHPFHTKKYSLVHNGTIHDWNTTAKRLNIDLRTETDSEIMVKIIDGEDTAFSGVQKALCEISSRATLAIAFIQRIKEKRLFLFRKETNPIILMTSSELRAVFFASDERFLEKAFVSVMGKKSKKEFIEIPSWQLFEIGWDKNGNPKKLASSKIKIVQPKDTMLVKQATMLPVHIPEKNIRKIATKKQLEQVSTMTAKDVNLLTKEINLVSEVMLSIRKNLHMQNIERNHFRAWLNQI